MSIHQHEPAIAEQLEQLAAMYGNRVLIEPAPDEQLPEHGRTATDAMRLIAEKSGTPAPVIKSIHRSGSKKAGEAMRPPRYPPASNL